MDITEKIDMMLGEASYNSTNVDELVIYITGDSDAYKRRAVPIIQNLRKKVAKGVFKKELSVKSWKPLVDEMAKEYDKKYNAKGAVTFSVADRKQAAIELADYYDEMVQGDGRL